MSDGSCEAQAHNAMPRSFSVDSVEVSVIVKLGLDFASPILLMLELGVVHCLITELYQFNPVVRLLVKINLFEKQLN